MGTFWTCILDCQCWTPGHVPLSLSGTSPGPGASIASRIASHPYLGMELGHVRTPGEGYKSALYENWSSSYGT